MENGKNINIRGLIRMTKTVTIDKEEYKELLEDQKFLYALQAAGVDNWDGYEYAQDIYQEENESEEDLEDE